MDFPRIAHASYGVYRIVAPSGSCYIGMTIGSFANRWKGHLILLRNGKHHCKGLLRAYKKYGEENLSFEILEDMTGIGESEILWQERYWWRIHKPWINLYNGEPSARGAVLHTEETRMAISKSIRLNFEYEIRLCLLCSKEFEISVNKVKTFCSKSCELKSKGHGKMPSKDLLFEMYWVEELSLVQIADLYGVTQESTKRWLIKNRIPRRDRMEQRVRLRKIKNGEISPDPKKYEQK